MYCSWAYRKFSIRYFSSMTAIVQWKTRTILLYFWLIENLREAISFLWSKRKMKNYIIESLLGTDWMLPYDRTVSIWSSFPKIRLNKSGGSWRILERKKVIILQFSVGKRRSVLHNNGRLKKISTLWPELSVLVTHF